MDTASTAGDRRVRTSSRKLGTCACAVVGGSGRRPGLINGRSGGRRVSAPTHRPCDCGYLHAATDLTRGRTRLGGEEVSPKLKPSLLFPALSAAIPTNISTVCFVFDSELHPHCRRFADVAVLGPKHKVDNRLGTGPQVHEVAMKLLGFNAPGENCECYNSIRICL